MEKKHLSVSVAGKEITLETGKIARQAGGSVTLRCGDTVILATAVGVKEAAPDIDFFPMRVDYTEKFSSAGKSLGGFIKREGRPVERETLVCRLIDRPLRPLFQDGYFGEVQTQATVLSYDSENPPEPMAITAVAAALVISDVPLKKPVAGVRLGMIDGNIIINPSIKQQEESILDLMLAGTSDAIMMIEGYCDFLTEEQIMAAIEEGHAAIKTLCDAMSDWQKLVGKEKFVPTLVQPPESLVDGILELVGSDIEKALNIGPKLEREGTQKEISTRVKEKFLAEGSEYTKPEVTLGLKKATSKLLRRRIFEENKRCDGRACDEIRPIDIEPGFLPRTHGSALFTRGETQAICVATLGPEDMGQRYETLEGDGIRRFYLQYSFPPYSVGEVGRIGPPGRREVGHGKLAERAIEATFPDMETFPYTVRLESNITESNGSSSMASVCGGCIALMNAGVPIARPVAGIAMGLCLDGDKHIILSDILGIEDAIGDMDFKITGDDKGITAFQLDIKVEGITPHIMQAALAQAKQGRIHILQKMLAACPESAKELSQYAPRIESIQVKPSKIGMIIGPGGKQIRAITEETGVEVNINDDGLVQLASTDGEAMKRAKQIIHDIVVDLEEGTTYKGTVVSIVDFGVFVKIFSKEGLLHVSEIDYKRIEKPGDVFKEGDEVEVKVLEINDRGQIRLSRKALMPKPEGYVEQERPPRRENKGGGRGGRDRDRGGRDRGGRDDRRRDDNPKKEGPQGDGKLLSPPPLIKR